MSHFSDFQLCNWNNFVMCSLASKCVPTELVPCSDRWRWTWWHTINMKPGMPVSSIPQCKLHRDESTCLQSFQAIQCFEPTFLEAPWQLTKISKLRLLKSRIKINSFLDDIITCLNTVFKDSEWDIIVGIWQMHLSTWQTVTHCVIVRAKPLL